MKELCNDCAVIPFGLNVGLQIVCHGHLASNIKIAPYLSEKATEKLRSILRKELARDAKGDDPVFEEDVHHVR